MKIQRRLQPSPRRGGAIVMTLTTLVAVSTLSVVMVQMAGSSQSEQRRATERVHAQYVAEAAANRAVALVRADQTGQIGSQQATVTHGASQYWVDSAVNNTGDVRTLTATAVDDRTTARLEVTLRSVPDSIWRFAAFGKDSLHMDSNARVDSYDSTLGTWATQAVNGSGSNQYAHEDGNVGSNGNITMDQNSKVWGDAECGPSSSTTVLGNAVVTGTTSPASSPVDMPPITMPSYVSSGNLTVNGTLNIASGNRRYDTLNMKANSIVNITGPANIVVTNFFMRAGSQFKVNATNGPVVLYVIDDFTLAAGARMYPTNYDPSKLEINLLSDNIIDPGIVVDLDVVDFSSNTKIYGTIYAPDALIEVNSNLELFGSMMARDIDLDSNARVHYDENLARVKTTGDVVWEKVAWRPLPLLPHGSAN
ncbi:MAG: hypothetical protein NTV21_20015 [Planctomycetota bacterium]|nr:hypothetical protein [Planctomycetota bacterium]